MSPLTREQSDEYVQRIRAALAEVGREDLGAEVHTQPHPEREWGPGISYYPGASWSDADLELIIRAAYVAGVPDAVCVACWKAEKGCTEPFHADDCEEWGEGR